MKGAPPIITLTTDFGYQDHYVSAMKAVILNINPEVRLVDVSHSIPAGDIMAGSWVINNSAPYFPANTIHLGVIDPGVGSSRKGIVARAGNQIYVGPDNGLFSLAYGDSEVQGYYIENPDYMRAVVSSTFHGRDIFAPVAAHLSKGISPESVGPRAGRLETYKMPMPIVDEEGIEGCVVHIDSYGNLITNISENELKEVTHNKFKIYLGREILDKIVDTFSDVPEGEAAAIVGSSGMLEIAVNKGNAREMLSVQKGDSVSIIFRNNDSRS